MFPTKAYPEEYVKKAVSDLKEKIFENKRPIYSSELKEIIDEIFGEFN
ncbi:MAG: hypothetical protein GWP19_00905 [Planctomycetia bacterium]|nr:hypothetical protein [Planctomycetia bacterium]